MNKSHKKSTFKNSSKDFSKIKPTKIFIDSSKKNSSKDDEKQSQVTSSINKNNKEDSSLNSEKLKDKVIHENNLQVIEILQKQLDQVESENKIIEEEMTRLKNENEDLKEKYEKIRDDIEAETEELEELKDINDSKNREYLQLTHLRVQQINSSSNNTDRGNNNTSRINTNSTNSERENSQNHGERFTLGEVMDGILRMSRIGRGEGGEGDIPLSPFFVFHSNENNEDGPPMNYSQMQALPSSSYPRNNYNNEKCSICGFEFCYNDVVTKLVKCNHTFHKTCLVNRLSARQSSKCPTCKVSII